MTWTGRPRRSLIPNGACMAAPPPTPRPPLSAFDALKAAHKKPSVNIKVLWEGEEEAGSPHLAQTLKTHAADLAADLWLIGDGSVHQSRTPTLYFGARGSLSLEATVFGPVKALHDGHYGNWVPNPAALAAELITELRAP